MFPGARITPRTRYADDAVTETRCASRTLFPVPRNRIGCVDYMGFFCARRNNLESSGRGIRGVKVRLPLGRPIPPRPVQALPAILLVVALLPFS